MNTNEVVYEYGKLHLNFVAQSNQLQLTANALAQANKEKAESDQKLKQAEQRVGMITKIMMGRYESPMDQLLAAGALVDEWNNPGTLRNSKTNEQRGGLIGLAIERGMPAPATIDKFAASGAECAATGVADNPATATIDIDELRGEIHPSDLPAAAQGINAQERTLSRDEQRRRRHEIRPMSDDEAHTDTPAK